MTWLIAAVLALVAIGAAFVLAACVAVMTDRSYLGLDDDIHP
jgi:hypothetical protein